jgi:hypothetical protein
MKTLLRPPSVHWLCCLALLVLFGGRPLCAAEATVAAPQPDIKALLDEHLADWEDGAERQAVLRMLHDVFPARLADLGEVLARNRDEAHEITEHLIHQSSRLVDLKGEAPAEYERELRLCRLDDECLALGRKAQAAQGQAKEALLAELRKKLAEAFDAKQEAMKRGLTAMEAEVENLRRRVAKRAENRDQLIDRRVLDLLGDREAEW